MLESIGTAWNILAAALEVKDERSLHNYVLLLTESLVQRDEYMIEGGTIKSDIRSIAETMGEGFRRMDERFEGVDKRFEELIGQMTRGSI